MNYTGVYASKREESEYIREKKEKEAAENRKNEIKAICMRLEKEKIERFKDYEEQRKIEIKEIEERFSFMYKE